MLTDTEIQGLCHHLEELEDMKRHGEGEPEYIQEAIDYIKNQLKQL